MTEVIAGIVGFIIGCIAAAFIVFWSFNRHRLREMEAEHEALQKWIDEGGRPKEGRFRLRD